jgi:hypothetical protein
MLWLFKKFFDPNTAREEQEDLRRQREDWPPDVSPDDVDLEHEQTEAPPERRRCRVCGHEAEDVKFCPTCLAETMVPIK